jgi:Glycosyltransferase 61
VSRLLRDVADSVQYYERSCVHRSNAEIRVSAAGLPVGDSQYGLELTTAEVPRFRLTDCILDSDGVVLFKDGEEVTDTRYLLPSGYKSNPDERTLIKLQSGSDYILGYNRGSEGYHHWLFQCLPAIDWGMRQKRDRPVRLVLPRLVPWQEEMVKLLGYSEVPRVTVEPGKYYAFPELDYAGYLNGKTAAGVAISVYETGRRMLANVPDTTGHTPILFVPFSNAYYGPLTNLREATDILRRLGVTVVSKDLRADVRLNLFRNAEVVIGPYGPELADVLFCRPGTLLWEWIPEHHKNTAINRLAQTAQLDYWGDVFRSEGGTGFPSQWSTDLNLIRRRVAEISERLAKRHTSITQPSSNIPILRNAKPIEELMLEFESLGENCDFGLMQRHTGAEPLGLYRFSGTNLDQLIRTLSDEFKDVGNPENFRIVITGKKPHQEYMIADKSIGGYHTFISPDRMTEAELRTHQARHLTFLRRKILEDLKVGGKIWVWKEAVASSSERILALLETLRRFGPNRLLWVSLADGKNPPGKVEQIGADLIRGYVRPRPEEGSNDQSFPMRPWFEVCDQAYGIWHAQEEKLDKTETTNQPLCPLSAMDILRRGPVQQLGQPEVKKQAGWLARLWSRLSLRH